MLRLLPHPSWADTAVRRVVFPWTFSALAVLIALVAPLSVYPRSRPMEIVFAVCAGVLGVVVIANTVLTGAQEWANRFLPRVLRKSNHRTLGLLPALDVLSSNAVAAAGVLMSFWVCDNSTDRLHYYFFLEQKNAAQTVWTAFVYFLSSAAFLVVGTAAFGPVLPIEPETAAFAASYCYYGKIIDVMLLAITIQRLDEIKRREKRDRQREKATRPTLQSREMPSTVTVTRRNPVGYAALPTTDATGVYL